TPSSSLNPPASAYSVICASQSNLRNSVASSRVHVVLSPCVTVQRVVPASIAAASVDDSVARDLRRSLGLTRKWIVRSISTSCPTRALEDEGAGNPLGSPASPAHPDSSIRRTGVQRATW